MVASNSLNRSQGFVQYVHRRDVCAVALDPDYPVPKVDLTAALAYPPCDFLPHLAGSEFRIEKSLDETGFAALLRGVRRIAKWSCQGMPKRFRDRQAFDALRTPLRGNLTAWHAPDLLGIALEEGLVQTRPEP